MQQHQEKPSLNWEIDKQGIDESIIRFILILYQRQIDNKNV